jgi:hypothetical protein
MKKIFLPIFLGLFSFHSSRAQDVAPANVYPSNLEENMYFEKYDDASKKITGLHFMVLSDGDNSQKVTPAFTVKLYLMPEGKSSINDLVVVKTYELPGIYQMGSKEYNNETVDLKTVKISSGNYRLGIWVNADDSFKEESSDNATLFKGIIAFTANSSISNNLPENTNSTVSEESEEIKSESDDFSGGFNANFKRNKKEAETKSNQNHQQSKQVKEETKVNIQETKVEMKEAKTEIKEEAKKEIKSTPATEKKTETATKTTSSTTKSSSTKPTTTTTSTSKTHTTKKK